MSVVPLIPDTAPFTPEQRAWLNGFFAGLFSRALNSDLPSPISASKALTPLTILYGSQTGTAEALAKKAAKEAGKRGFVATVLDMAQTDTAKLAHEKNLLVIVSTYGDGEPPDSAKSLHTALASAVGSSLASAPVGSSLASAPVDSSLASAPFAALRYSVCALGDTNYPQFCQCGQDFDTYLGNLGATRVTPRTDCDLDYESSFTTWLNTSLSALHSANVGGALRPDPAREVTSSSADEPAAPTYSKKNPFPALLLTSRNLNSPGSAKQVHHVEFDLTGSGLAYEAGDALGVIPHNCPEHVSEILAALGCDGEEAVAAPDGATVPFRRALAEFYDLGKPTAELLARLPVAASVTTRSAAPLPTPCTPHHVLDVLLHSQISIPKSPLTPPDFVRLLKKLQPRLYSISSSPRAHSGQVHLTVGAVRYEKDGRPRQGVCSTFLADRAQPGTTRVGVFVHSNTAFRPPAHGDTPTIMVGPGTGIAPFRAFLHERKATGAKGKNWLLFGDQRAATDFLYRDELAALMHDGVLTRLDTAFSRDQAEKLYVQQRMLENAAELYAWLESAAHFYVCGDASRMAKDVDAALHQVVERAGGKTPEQAAAYVQSLKAAKRYARDVY